MITLMLQIFGDKFITQPTYKIDLPLWICINRQASTFTPDELMQNVSFELNQRLMPQFPNVEIQGDQDDFNLIISQGDTCNKYNTSYLMYIFKTRQTACILTCQSNKLPRVIQYQFSIAGSVQNSIFIVYKDIMIDRSKSTRYPKQAYYQVIPLHFSPYTVFSLVIKDIFNNSIVLSNAQIELENNEKYIQLLSLAPQSKQSKIMFVKFHVPCHGYVVKQLIIDTYEQQIDIKIIPQYFIIWSILLTISIVCLLYGILYLNKQLIVSKFSLRTQQIILKYLFFNKLEAALFQAKEHYDGTNIMNMDQLMYHQEMIMNKMVNDIEEAESSTIVQKNFYEDDNNKLLSYLFPQVITELNSEENSSVQLISPVFLLDDSQKEVSVVSHLLFYVNKNQTQSEFTYVEYESIIFGDNKINNESLSTALFTDDESDQSFNIFQLPMLPYETLPTECISNKVSMHSTDSEDSFSEISSLSVISKISRFQAKDKTKMSIKLGNNSDNQKQINIMQQSISQYNKLDKQQLPSIALLPELILNFGEDTENSNIQSIINDYQEFSSLTDSDPHLIEKIVNQILDQGQVQPPLTARFQPLQIQTNISDNSENSSSGSTQQTNTARYLPLRTLEKPQSTIFRQFQHERQQIVRDVSKVQNSTNKLNLKIQAQSTDDSSYSE
ncbi:hypothetical protein SS50377_27919 [Spironucleus salmonicida]|uniref:Transmembrane protein n=1 Tax=Spironucleus salmonicida TaxID=348837 RepID=V6LDA1_9EUKA|nr:hypothetical protein SS50377_27919 [Spironucleus salmonicida]|eukprot:EST42480.1 Hypothetical protein SS50377_17786 [Spironucleus salmonicida]